MAHHLNNSYVMFLPSKIVKEAPHFLLSLLAMSGFWNFRNKNYQYFKSTSWGGSHGLKIELFCWFIQLYKNNHHCIMFFDQILDNSHLKYFWNKPRKINAKAKICLIWRLQLYADLHFSGTKLWIKEKPEPFLNLPWGHVIGSQIFGAVGSAVLTFIGFKQTSKVWEPENSGIGGRHLDLCFNLK